MTGTTCSSDSGLAGGASCNIVVAYHPTACPVGGCTALEPAVDVDLIVKATPGIATTGLTITDTTLGTALPRLTGTATASPTTSAYLVESTTGLSPFTFGALASGTSTATLVLTAGSSTVSIATTDLPVIADTLSTGSVVIASEFAITAGVTNTCTPASGGPNVLAANGTCSFNVVWTPGTAAAGKRELTVTLKGAVATLVAIKPTAAHLTATPAGGLDFGQVLQGADSATLTLTVTNDGETATAANLQAVKTGHSNEVIVAAGGCQGAPLAAGQSCTLSIKVHPSATGDIATGVATVTVQQVGGASPTAAIDMLWTGMAAAQITPSDNAPDFGTVAVGAVSTATPIALTNQTLGQITGPLSISVDNTDFVVSAVTASGLLTTDCGHPNFAKGLDGGGTCNIFVKFSPKALTPAAKTGTLTITSTSTAGATVALTGTATSALTVDQASVAFSSTSISAAVGSQPTVDLIFTNATGAPKTGQLIAALTGADFRTIVDGCTGTQLAGGGSCTITVRFNPTTAGAKTGSLVVSGTPGNSATSSFTGTATSP